MIVSPEAYQALAPKLLLPVQALLGARAKAKVLRERADAAGAEILASEGPFYPSPEWDDVEPHEPMTDPSLTYLLTEADFERYERLRAARLNHPYGECPACSAEWARTQAENLVIDTAKPVTGLANEDLLLGTDDLSGIETRATYLDLLCNMALSESSS